MFKMKSVLLSGVATFAAASMAQASDLPSKAAAAAPVVKHASAHNWTGFSIGIGGGAAMLQAQDYVNSNVYSSGNGYIHSQYAQQNDLGKFGGFGTIQVGADYQAGGLVMGAFADYNLGSVEASSSQVSNCYDNAPYSCIAFRDSSVKVGNSWDVGARLGFVVSDNALVYALAGYSVAKISLHSYHNAYSNGNFPGQPWANVESNSDHNKGGLLLGAGFEYALTENVSLKTEYRYVNYGTVSDSATGNWNYNPGGAMIEHSAKVDVQSVRALLSYKF